MGLIDEITTVRFSGRHRLREIMVIAEVLEDPVRARLLVDGVERERQDLPARFELGDGAAVEVSAKGRTITDCAVVADGRRTQLTLAPDSLVRRYLRIADGHPAAEIARGIVFFVVIPILLVAGLARLINISLLERPLSAIGVSQPVDLPWAASWWFVPVAVVLLVLLGAEEDLRKAYRRFLAPVSGLAPASMAGPARAPAAGTSDGLATSSSSREPDAWDHRLDQWGRKVANFSRARFAGRHAGQELSVVFDFFDEPTHVRLLVDGEDRGNRSVPASFDLGDGAQLEANATQWAVLECAVVAGGIRTRLMSLDDQIERVHHRFFDAHPVIETVVRSVGAVVIVAAAILGAIDIYNLVLQWDVLRDLPLVGWLPRSIDLPIGLSWWQALLILGIPAIFEFDHDVRRSNRVFGPESKTISQVADRTPSAP